MPVDFVKLKRTYDLYANEYETAVLRAMRSGWYILGKELEDFENKFAEYMGTKYCVGVNSGLDALILAVRALDIGPGDEVIVPANTYIASALGITENGAKPVFVEPDKYFCIDAEKIEEAITERTKAILPVHLYGQPCDMQKICEVAKKYHLFIIEDCAQSHDAVIYGQKTGTFGTIGCFSFYPTKPMGALGDAGALLTNDKDLAQKLRALRNYGSAKKYVNDITGKNTRLDEVQAAILKVSMFHLHEGNVCRNRIVDIYREGINNPLVKLPEKRENAYHVYHVYPLLCEQRDGLQKYLLNKEIHTLIHYPIPPHLQKCYAYLGYEKGDYPISESYAAQELSLPIYAGMPDEEVEMVIEAVNSYRGE